MARLIPGEAIDSLVVPRELLESIRRAYLSTSSIPHRVAVERGGVWIGVMPGLVEGMGFAVKVVGIFPNAVPPIRGLVVLLDYEKGEFLSVMDGTVLTGWRTAATTALAYQLLDGAKGRRLGIIGAGTQGKYHARVFARLFSPSELLVYDKELDRAKKLAEEFGGSAVELTRLLEACDVVISATNSREPVVLGKYVRGGAVVLSIGAPRPVRELDDETLRRAKCSLVDSVEGVMRETDDKAERLVSIREFLEGTRCDFGDIKLYKSVGFALLDVAAAHYVYKKALELGIGVEAEL